MDMWNVNKEDREISHGFPTLSKATGISFYFQFKPPNLDIMVFLWGETKQTEANIMTNMMLGNMYVNRPLNGIVMPLHCQRNLGTARSPKLKNTY